MELLGARDLSRWSVRPLTDHPVRYDAQSKNGRFLIHATSRSAASFFVRHVTFSPSEFPCVEWDWRVDCPVRGEDLTTKGGNDCSARILVGFKGDWSEAGYLERRAVRREIEETGYEPPGTFLVYVWAHSLPEGTVRDDPHVGPRAKVLVVTAGEGKQGIWQHVRRNMADDYRKVFGCEPPPVISIALLTDTDDTQSEAESDYGMIVAKASQGEVPNAKPLVAREIPSQSATAQDSQPEQLFWKAVAALGIGLVICVLFICRRARKNREGGARTPDAVRPPAAISSPSDGRSRG